MVLGTELRPFKAIEPSIRPLCEAHLVLRHSVRKCWARTRTSVGFSGSCSALELGCSPFQVINIT